MRKQIINTAVCIVAFFLAGCLTIHAQQRIIVADMADPQLAYAGKELQRYIYQLTGQLVSIDSNPTSRKGAAFIIGKTPSDPFIKDFINQGLLTDESSRMGEEGYALHKIKNETDQLIIITANTSVGCLYGVYGLLDDYYQVGFYMSGDVMPQQKQAFYLPDVSECKQPEVHIRGFLPWTNFPQSATVYSWEDWKSIIDQTAKMRMNFIHIHNYNGQNGHNEMYHNFTVDGHTSRVWMPTAKSGHRWGCPGFEVKNFRFGGDKLFGDYDFGAACALHNESLTNEEVFRKGTSVFKKVIGYAHERGVKMGLGIDIDLIMPEYQLQSDDPAVIEARIKQITDDYPDLDYLILFVSEMINHDEAKLQQWQRIFNGMYGRMKTLSPSTRIAVAGWGLKKEIAAQLPGDVIAAPISGYSDQFEDGSIYGDREYWGCPWLERDVYSSCYYYPYEMDLSNTIAAYKKKAPNMKGLYCLSWRITDAVDAKLSYIAKAPWDSDRKYQSSYDLYHEYALRNYGNKSAETITGIINENEPMCSKISECQSTATFTGDDLYKSDYLFNIKSICLYQRGKLLKKIKAYDCQNSRGVKKLIADPTDSCITEVNPGDYLLFKNIDFGESVLEMSATVSTQNSKASVEFRLDKPDGRTLGIIDVIHSGGWQNWSEQRTNIYEVKGIHDLYVVFNTRQTAEDPYKKAIEQSRNIFRCIASEPDKGMQQRMGYLRCRIDAVRDYIDIDKSFPQILSAGELPGQFPSWVQNFMFRVNDISSLGNTQSIQNRYIQERYLKKVQDLVTKAAVKFPTNLTASGTNKGALLSWTNNEPEATGYIIYRNGTELKIPEGKASVYQDTFNGQATYQIAAISTNGRISERSESISCQAGISDKEAPRIIVVSPPSSVKKGQSAGITARLLDNRSDQFLSATLYFRKAGDTAWKRKKMNRKTKAIFCADLPSDTKSSLIEYYIKADDGNNSSVYPATAPELNGTLVYESPANSSVLPPVQLHASDSTLSWTPADQIYMYHIFRAKGNIDQTDPSTYVTYLPAGCSQFKDLAPDFDGKKLKGSYQYIVIAEDKDGNQSKASNRVTIDW